MTKSVQQYVKIFEMLQNAKTPVPVSKIKAIDGIVPTRLSTYMWEIKKNTGFAVKPNRDGRTVVSYELVGSGTAPVAKTVAPKVAKVATPKPVKAKTSAKVKTVKSKAPELKQDSLDSVMNAMAKKPIDILDSIDTEITDFDDREFASGFARGVY